MEKQLQDAETAQIAKVWFYIFLVLGIVALFSDHEKSASIGLFFLAAIGYYFGGPERAERRKQKEEAKRVIAEELNYYFNKYLDCNSLSSPCMEELQVTDNFKNELKKIIRQTFRGKDRYAIFLKTPYWRCISEYCKRQVNYKCQKCGQSDTQIDVHHDSYDIHGEEHLCWSSLSVLCNNCHKSAHGRLDIDAPDVDSF